jgi:hypothetical protein
MAATLVVGVLLAFGRWAGHERMFMGFVYVAPGAVPASWVLAIEYGLLISMVAAVIRADRVDAMLSSAETLTWLGGICLFTAGLYHDHYRYGRTSIWGGSVNGYGTFTSFVSKPLLEDVPFLLTAWPMAYGAVVMTTSFIQMMGWKRPIMRWRWTLHAIVLVSVTTLWILLVLWPWNFEDNSRWPVGSLVVLPTLVLTLALMRGPDRKISSMNLIAAVCLLTALVPRLDGSPVSTLLTQAFDWMDYGVWILIIGGLLVLGGSIASLESTLAKR